MNLDGVAIEMDLQPGLPLCLAEPTRLQQVFLNLLNNARQAVEEKGDDARVRFTSRYEAEHERLLVEVSDNGPGIPDGLRDRIFEPFFSTKETGKGTGLGLSICRGILREAGGTIRALPSEEGARLRVEIPAAAADVTEIVVPDRYPSDVRSGRILAVDDEPRVRRLLERALAEDHHEVVTVASGEDALEVLDRQEFDVILTDLRMPDMTGMSLYEHLSTRRPELAERVVFFTGAALTDQQEDFFRRVGRIVLRKPFHLEELRGAVRQALAELPRGPMGDPRQTARDAHTMGSCFDDSAKSGSN
jgi:CheY-like chemotaxis protein